MDIKGFNGKAGTLSLASTPEGVSFYEFNPHSLPVKVEADNELDNLLERANREIGFLNGIGRRGISPELLVYTYKRKEAVASSRIEGTVSSFKEAAIAEAQEKFEKLRRVNKDRLETLNMIKTTDRGLALIKTNDINIDLFLELHKTLMDKIDDERSVGELRTGTVFIKGKLSGKIEDAFYVPPNATNVRDLLTNLFEYLNSSKYEISDLLKIGIIHYHFEAIHPFCNGNGRLGRLLILLYLTQKRILEVPILYLSGYLEKNRDIYYDLLLRVSQEGDYLSWLKFFLEGIITQTKDTRIKESKLVGYYTEYKEKIMSNPQHKTERGKALEIFDALISDPIINIPTAKELLKVTYPTAKSVINDLVNLDILTEVSGRRTRKIYVADNIMNIFKD